MLCLPGLTVLLPFVSLSDGAHQLTFIGWLTIIPRDLESLYPLQSFRSLVESLCGDLHVNGAVFYLAMTEKTVNNSVCMNMHVA